MNEFIFCEVRKAVRRLGLTLLFMAKVIFIAVVNFIFWITPLLIGFGLSFHWLTSEIKKGVTETSLPVYQGSPVVSAATQSSNSSLPGYRTLRSDVLFWKRFFEDIKR